MTRRRYLLKQICFTPSFSQDISSTFRVLVLQNFVDRSLITLFSLVLFCTCETYLSTSSQMSVFGDRTKNVRKFDCFQSVSVLWDTRGAQRRKFSSVTRQLLKKARSPLHNMGSILRSDHLWVCRVSAMITTLSFAFTFCNNNISSEHISTGLPRSSSCGKFILQSCYRIVSQPQSVLSRIRNRGKMSNCHHTCFNRWSQHVHDRSAVRVGVSQQTHIHTRHLFSPVLFLGRCAYCDEQ